MPAGRPDGARENVAMTGKEAADAGVAVHTVHITCVALPPLLRRHAPHADSLPTPPPVPVSRRSSRDGTSVFPVRAAADRVVLFEAEEQGFVLPAACRMGCCTACAVRVTAGALAQPHALGLSAGLRAEGYALLCVAYATAGDVAVQLQDPDEVYDRQFGAAFDALATDKRAPSVTRDDFALEIAAGDE